MKKVIKIAAGLVVAASLAVLGFTALPGIQARIVLNKKANAQRGILNCSELVTYKGCYTCIVYEDRAFAIKKNTKGYSVVRVKGVIMGGIDDVSKIKIDVSKDGKSVVVTMPHCKILENGISSEEAISETGTFLRVKLEDLFVGIDNAKKEVEEELVANGFLTDADEYAQEAVRQIMTAVKFDNIEVQYE